MNILVTGAAGYIGATFAFQCIKQGHEVIGIDNFINSSKKNINVLIDVASDNFNFIEYDLSCDCEDLYKQLKDHKIDTFVHFAGLKSVEESESNTLKYWENNLYSTINLVKLMKKLEVFNLIFSSSATVYGANEKQPLEEYDHISPISCYGSTKISNEYFLADVVKDSQIKVISLRYFNPVGAHKEMRICEEIDQSPNNLMPRIIRVAKGIDEKIMVYGNDYETKDGTGERDYIHIEDLVNAHISSIQKINDLNGFNVFNIGTGKKHTVVELIEIFKRVNNVDVPYEFAQRREGDVAICYANSQKAKKILNWEANCSLEKMCKDAWDAIK